MHEGKKNSALVVNLNHPTSNRLIKASRYSVSVYPFIQLTKHTELTKGVIFYSVRVTCPVNTVRSGGFKKK